jgi:hypothetical protein
MLTSNMRERNSGRIQVKNMKLRTGRELLHYIYNGRLQAALATFL